MRGQPVARGLRQWTEQPNGTMILESRVRVPMGGN